MKRENVIKLIATIIIIILICCIGVTSCKAQDTLSNKYWSNNKIQDLNDKQIRKNDLTKEWLVISGTALVASSACNIIAQNINKHSKDYSKNVKSLNDASIYCKAFSGISLIIGVTIYFK
jgi:hypothetical protein